MVGLWNLTNIDASFAQAGTNTPHLFNVATLADYGAVFAEYPIDCASVIQMRYRMAYNLIFEIVRDNIQFPENSDAYAANGTFHARINQIINLYKDAKQSSYGVRDELRASIQTVKALFPVAKQKMAAYVNAKTVIWIPSRIYFDFWIRHIQEIKFLQTSVTKHRPSNLIKTIVTNPCEDSFTRFVSQGLYFQPSSQCFGIFFLPTLHRHTLAVHHMEQDDDAVIQHVTSTNGKCKQRQKDIKKILEELRSTPLEPIHHGMRLQTFFTPILLCRSRSRITVKKSLNTLTLRVKIVKIVKISKAPACQLAFGVTSLTSNAACLCQLSVMERRAVFSESRILQATSPNFVFYDRYAGKVIEFPYPIHADAGQERVLPDRLKDYHSARRQNYECWCGLCSPEVPCWVDIYMRNGLWFYGCEICGLHVCINDVYESANCTVIYPGFPKESALLPIPADPAIIQGAPKRRGLGARRGPVGLAATRKRSSIGQALSKAKNHLITFHPLRLPFLRAAFKARACLLPVRPLP
ncbi:hypothetical protein M422DRAFT_266760 [Sphaerobolus stellatus SS14]|uniref:Uncharacterized protein n=1 Tax=Sphaerobolus stellatus (strain SS14) TaxID=990650 RepID=A0A0C9UAE5_SPHS4|nr:hypothetical protein M422DRAFT_266760 [Sphaerobolus stellatus SS14]